MIARLFSKFVNSTCDELADRDAFLPARWARRAIAQCRPALRPRSLADRCDRDRHRIARDGDDFVALSGVDRVRAGCTDAPPAAPRAPAPPKAPRSPAAPKPPRPSLAPTAPLPSEASTPKRTGPSCRVNSTNWLPRARNWSKRRWSWSCRRNCSRREAEILRERNPALRFMNDSNASRQQILSLQRDLSDIRKQVEELARELEQQLKR